MVSRRRMLSFLGLATAVGFAAPPMDADAQTPGMERRQQRRQGRVERRYKRRGGQPAQGQPGTSAPAAGGPATGAPATGAAAPSQPPQK
jgi:hypothetical protein